MSLPDFMVCVDGVEVETFVLGKTWDGWELEGKMAIQRALDEKHARPDALVTIVLTGEPTEGEKAQGVIQVGLGR